VQPSASGILGRGRLQMSFLTTVKATGELFDAATDLGADKNLSQEPHLPLEATKFYAGHHFKGSIPNPETVRFEDAVYAVFRGDELELHPDKLRRSRP
jgi:hypothetical protein